MQAEGYSLRISSAAPVLLDVTRLLELRWTCRQPNGIDRVAVAYLRHLRHVARAVVQHRGVIRVLGADQSQRLFDVLERSDRSARVRLAALVSVTLAAPASPRPGSLYLNVTHTDFDLPAHVRWIARFHLRAVYVLHDLIPILHPEHCRPRAVMRHASRVRTALCRASGIIVGSAAVAKDLRDYAHLHGLRTPAIAVAPFAGAALKPVQTFSGDYFLCVGTIESRKNHRLLLRVWERLRVSLGPEAPSLVIVGRWGWGSSEIREALAASGMAGGLIRVVDDCDDVALEALMAGARAMLMPSLAEGFGLPMAEALALGVPVIASDIPVFREVGAGIPCLLDPNDERAWEQRIASLDPAAALRQRRIMALHGYRPPDWGNHFERVVPWLAKLGSANSSAAAPGRRTADLEH